MKYLKPAFVLSLIAAGATWSCMSFAATESRPVKNIVLVHGAWVNGSGWKPVFEILVKDGYHVSVAEHPLTSFNDDLTAVKRVLAMQEGPTILVGHSYGGAIITDVGNDHMDGPVGPLDGHQPGAGLSDVHVTDVHRAALGPGGGSQCGGQVPPITRCRAQDRRRGHRARGWRGGCERP